MAHSFAITVGVLGLAFAQTSAGIAKQSSHPPNASNPSCFGSVCLPPPPIAVSGGSNSPVGTNPSGSSGSSKISDDDGSSVVTGGGSDVSSAASGGWSVAGDANKSADDPQVAQAVDEADRSAILATLKAAAEDRALANTCSPIGFRFDAAALDARFVKAISDASQVVAPAEIDQTIEVSFYAMSVGKQPFIQDEAGKPNGYQEALKSYCKSEVTGRGMVLADSAASKALESVRAILSTNNTVVTNPNLISAKFAFHF